MNYTVKYSDRKTLSITVRNAQVIVRSPKNIDKRRIEAFVTKHSEWINEKVKQQSAKINRFNNLSESDIAVLKTRAREYFNWKTNDFAAIMGLKYGKIKITSAKTRFGSCNSNGTICFSYRLMLYPEKAREYVIVHELAHLVHMNHSKAFYKLVESYMPDYKERKRLLKEQAPFLIFKCVGNEIFSLVAKLEREKRYILVK